MHSTEKRCARVKVALRPPMTPGSVERGPSLAALPVVELPRLPSCAFKARARIARSQGARAPPIGLLGRQKRALLNTDAARARSRKG